MCLSIRNCIWIEFRPRTHAGEVVQGTGSLLFAAELHVDRAWAIKAEWNLG